MLLTPARLKQDVLPNPARRLTGAGLLSAERSVSYSTLIGALDGETILVAARPAAPGSPITPAWPRPLVADYAALEVAIKFDLEDCADALERYEFERALVGVNQLGARLDPSVPPSLEKALAAVRRVRHLAGDACGPDIQPYFAALFVCTLERVLQVDPAIGARVKRLQDCSTRPSLAPDLPAPAIHRDHAGARPGVAARRQGALRDGGRRRCPVTPHEYEFLHYLWDDRDGVCDREAISSAVFRDAQAKTDPTRLNVLVARLRSKIEPDPRNPAYVVTVRGHGFRLLPHGRPPASTES